MNSNVLQSVQSNVKNPYASNSRKRPPPPTAARDGDRTRPSSESPSEVPKVLVQTVRSLLTPVPAKPAIDFLPPSVGSLLPGPFTSPVSIAGPGGAGKTNFMLASSLDRVINSWFRGEGDFILYLQAGMEVGAAGGSGVAKR